MKPITKYYVSVEGETELWYFEWLETILNLQESATKRISIYVKKKNPTSFVKGLSILDKVNITHVFDFESESEEHQLKFKQILTMMHDSPKIKSTSYSSGYSNFTFELWIILHKQICNGSICQRDDYLTSINHAYGTTYSHLDEYKHENNFKRILSQLTLDDIKNAIDRSKNIMSVNKANGYTCHQYRKFDYYKENPSLLVHLLVEKMLIDLKL